MTMNVSSRSGMRRSAPAVPSGSSSGWNTTSRSSGDRDWAKYSLMSSPRKLTHRSTRRTPLRLRLSTMCCSTGLSPIGTSGLGMTVVYGRRRVPSPPARMTACPGSSPAPADVRDCAVAAARACWAIVPDPLCANGLKLWLCWSLLVASNIRVPRIDPAPPGQHGGALDWPIGGSSRVVRSPAP